MQPWVAPLPLLRLALGIAFAVLGGSAFRPEGVDPYEVLGLHRGGDLDAATLKRAYRKAALRWHPDKVSEAEKELAEKRFIEIAWAYDVLSDPAQRANYDVPPQPGQAPPSGGAGGGPPPRDFSMDEAAKVFRKAFGTTSNEYRDLINHLMASAGTGDKNRWRRHAEAIAKALKKQGSNADFEVETKAKDGSESMKTSQTSTVDAHGIVTKKTVTQHTKTTVNGGPAALGGTGNADPALVAHMAAHEAALRAAQEAHRAALAGAGAAGALPGSGPHGPEL